MDQQESVIYAHQAPVVEASTRRPGRTNKTQLRLFQAAMDIMSSGGPTATTVEDIAERAGVSKGTVYYNFGSKKTMIDQLLQYGAKLLLAELEAAATPHTDPREALRACFNAAFRYIRQHPGFARLWVSELWRNGEEWSETTDSIRRDIMRYVSSLVHNLSTRYQVRVEQAPQDLAIILFGAVFMLSMDTTRHGARRTSEEATSIVMLTVDGYILGPLTS